MAVAADPFKNLQDELNCCLCLEYFKHPVLLKKCSHSFCKECITQHCKNKGTKAFCPSCRGSFGLNNLVENRSLANIVEIVQQIKQNPRAQGRKLESCQELLELFCRDDQEASESQYLKLSTGGLLNQLKDEVKMSEISEQVCVALGAVFNMRKDRTEMKDYVSRIRSSLTEDFTVMKKYINDQEKIVLEVFDQECRAAEKKIDGMVQLLEARTENLLELRNNSEELLKHIPTEQEVYIGSSTELEVTLDVQKINNVAHDVNNLKRLLEMSPLGNYLKQMLQEPSPGTSRTNDILMDVAGHAGAPSNNSFQPQDTHQETAGCSSSMEFDSGSSTPVISNQFSPWASNVMFDLERIHDKLELTQDKKRVTVSPFTCGYEHSPKRFRICQVMGLPSFSKGCHYWEVSTNHSTGWAIGVATGDIGSRDQLGRTELSWCIEWSNKKLSAWHKGQETQISEEKPLRVGTFLNIPQNSLSFYSCTDKEMCLHKFEIKIVSPIYPAFWIYGGGTGDFLTIYNVKKS